MATSRVPLVPRRSTAVTSAAEIRRAVGSAIRPTRARRSRTVSSACALGPATATAPPGVVSTTVPSKSRALRRRRA